MSNESDSQSREETTRYRRLRRIPSQICKRSPFSGSIEPVRVPLFALGDARPTLPIPHPWNYREPLRILETYFWGADREPGSGRHNRFLDVPGFAPVLVTRDPEVIRAISANTGAKDGQFDRDTMPSRGIARATGADTLLYANGAVWKKQKKISTPPFARTTLFQPERFQDFEQSFRCTARKRLRGVRERIGSEGEPLRVTLDLEIKSVMLEMLVNNFFGAEIDYAEIRERYVPALDLVIDYIVQDTVINKLGLPMLFMPSVTRRIAAVKAARTDFEDLTDAVISTRTGGKGLWSQFQSDAPDDALRSNIRVFLAGALEATTSYASWAISHLSRNHDAQERAYQEIRGIDAFTPDALQRAKYFGHVLDETLRLTPALYFHPRRARNETAVETRAGETLRMPAGTHILLDVWHANRHEDHWGLDVTGHPASEFRPERWETIEKEGRGPNDLLHFGFGHGPRFCPGKSLGQLEVALVVGAIIKLFEFKAVDDSVDAIAGVSTKPGDGVLVDIRLRGADTQNAEAVSPPGVSSASSGRCPYAR